MKHACLLALVVCVSCAFEDFLDTARTDSYHLEGKGIPSEQFELVSVPAVEGEIKLVHVQRASTPGPTILFCHGASANIETSWARAIVWYELGFDVVLFDYRGFGASSGSSFSEDSLYRDAELALAYTLDVRGVSIDDLVMYGHSLGGPVAAELALRKRPAALVLESTFTSLREQIRSNTDLETPDSFFTDFELDTAQKLARTGDVPKLVLHGQRDATWPVWNAHELYEVAPEPRQLAICEGCDHRTVLFHDPAWYRAALCFPGAPPVLRTCAPSTTP
jgi:pimeloyl-ACP methyl ester carboxylesterase